MSPRAACRLATLGFELRKAHLTTAVLTDPEGRLLGVVKREDLDA